MRRTSRYNLNIILGIAWIVVLLLNVYCCSIGKRLPPIIAISLSILQLILQWKT